MNFVSNCPKSFGVFGKIFFHFSNKLLIFFFCSLVRLDYCLKSCFSPVCFSFLAVWMHRILFSLVYRCLLVVCQVFWISFLDCFQVLLVDKWSHYVSCYLLWVLSLLTQLQLFLNNPVSYVISPWSYDMICSTISSGII